MSFSAKLYLDDKSYKILECSYSLHQPIDNNGKPIGKPKGGQIKLVLESNGETDLFHWMKEADLKKDGSIVFLKTDAASNLMVLKFKNAFCVNFVEKFVADTPEPMKTMLVISAQSIIANSLAHINTWGTK